MNVRGRSPVAFYLPLQAGERFCLLHLPEAKPRGGLLYVPPFAEEMNKSRRMAAAQARRFAAAGYAVLQMDLYGCGDSSGELREASIASWFADLEAAAGWLLGEGNAPLTVWGLRYGALLGAHWCAQTSLRDDVEGMVLWQPVTAGDVHLNQFLRIGVAADLLSAGSVSGASGELRKRLAAGEILEIAGYDLSAALAREMAALRLADMPPRGLGVRWLEVGSEDVAGVAPASARVLQSWRESGVHVREGAVTGAPFWATVEIVDSPALLDATDAAMSEPWTPEFASRP